MLDIALEGRISATSALVADMTDKTEILSCAARTTVTRSLVQVNGNSYKHLRHL
ncbi:MAG: hypothetical protein ACFFDI_01260 [Promethearchaeota archaeon]